LIKPKAAAAAAAAATASSAGTPAAAAGGTEQDWRSSPQNREDMLPAGMNEDGVIEDMQAYDAWLMSRHSGICSGVKRSISTTATATMSRMMSRLGEFLMLSFSQVKSAGSAGNYYTEKDNYYVIGSMEERWQGKGAEALGLEGKVDKQIFTELLQESYLMAAT
jgi:hypothetical protein